MMKIAKSLPAAMWIWFTILFQILFHNSAISGTARLLSVFFGSACIIFVELHELDMRRRIKALEEEINMNHKKQLCPEGGDTND